jgi:hypothetical protein
MRSKCLVAATSLGLVASPALGQDRLHPLPFLTVGLYFASIEEGARIFGPVRLLPFDHPEASGHEFPNPPQLHGSEYDVLVLLGEHSGLRLQATLQRYPQRPDPTWPYREFAQPPLEALRKAPVVRRPSSMAPLAGLRVIAFYRHTPVAFIVDTRGVSLAARGMTRPTTMGLDMTRAAFLAAVQRADHDLTGAEATIVVYGPSGGE